MNRWWHLSYRADPASKVLADRHYNRQNPDADQFVPPGTCVVLRTEQPVDAVWVTSWPLAEYVQHAWGGAWVNSLFRNEDRERHLSSDLIEQAVAATRAIWTPPPLGIVTFVDASKIRTKRDPGRCYRRAGWHHVGFTRKGLWVFQQLPDEMPAPLEPIGHQAALAI